MSTSVKIMNAKYFMRSATAPRYSSLWPFCRPKPFTSYTVMPLIPAAVRAARTFSTAKGLTIASIFFMAASAPQFRGFSK